MHLRTSLLVALAALFAGCSPSEPDAVDPRRARNVILFVVDTLRADRMSCYGYGRETTPRIDAWAAGGALFRRNYSQGCWTVPSMISMMSGLYVFDEEQKLPAEKPTLAELLQRANIATAGFAGNEVLVNDRGFQRGFDHFDGHKLDGRASVVVDHFLDWYEGYKKDDGGHDGFFAWVHSTDPHSDYTPPEPFQIWSGEPRLDEPEMGPIWREEIPRAEEHLLPDSPTIGQSLRGMRDMSNNYDGEVRSMDAAFGKMIDRLEADGILDETLIVFASDHGEILFEHPHYPQEIALKIKQTGGFPHAMQDLFAIGHRSWFHQELWNTPLIVAGPGTPAGVVDEKLRANLDIFTTVLAAFGLAKPSWIEGHDLREPESTGHDQVFGYGFETSAVIESTGKKLILHNRDRFLLDEDAPQPTELFDLNADPRERTDRSEMEAAEARRLTEAVRAWRERVKRPFSTEFSSRDEQALRNMGYIGDD